MGQYKSPKEGDSAETYGKIFDDNANLENNSVHLWNKLISDMNKDRRLVFLGASIGEGASSSDYYERSFRRQLLVALQKKYNTADKGYIRGSDTSKFINTFISTQWAHTGDVTAYGGGYMQVANNGARYIASDTFRYVDFVYEGGGGVFEVEVDGVILGQVDTAGVAGVTHSAEFDSGSYKNQELTIRQIGVTNTKIYGFVLNGESPANRCLDFQGYVRSGMASTDISTESLDDYFTTPAPCIDLVMSNDADANVLKTNTQGIIDRMNGRVMVLISTVLNGLKPDHDQAFRELATENDNVIFVSADDLVGDHAQVGDDLHWNNYGHRAVFTFFSQKLGLNPLLWSEMP